ncbi:MAG: Fic family protein [Myxococcales bacterium]|nr:Fic family protein [Myxococcales bacterium]
MHRRIFAVGLPTIAGRFRTGPGEFGGSNQHALKGAPPEEIASRLAQAFRMLDHPGFQRARSDVAAACARFLEVFFRIHPFADGNGRVGREILRWVCASRTRFRFNRFTTTSRERRKYFRVLEYAHQHAPGSTHDRRNDRVDPYRYLAKWLEKHLEEIPIDFQEIPPSFSRRP